MTITFNFKSLLLLVGCVFIFQIQELGALHLVNNNNDNTLNSTASEVLTQPEQVHLSYGDDPTQMVVTWVTLDKTSANSTVEFGVSKFNQSVTGTQTKFTDGGPAKRSIYIHKVILTGLVPNQRYSYHCGSTQGWSDLFFFTAMKSGQKWSPRFALFGDMGNKNARSLGRLQEETLNGNFDAILHVGDFAYDMDTGNAQVGDQFMRQIEPIAAYLPYMTCPGNHEQKYNFSNYKARFNMPSDINKRMFYRFDVGPVRFLSFNSEVYYEMLTDGGDEGPAATQYAWLDKELKEANLPENRAIHPWVITMCHRPLYCSDSDDKEHCPSFNNRIRTGIGVNKKYSIEDILYKYNVDMHFTAHEHSYERIYPVYNMTVCKGSEKFPYTNPNAPVNIVTGSAGCQEEMDPFTPVPYDYSAFHSTDYGYTRMTVFNATHIYMDQVSDVQEGKVIDSIWMVKTSKKPYTCHLQSKTP